MSVARFTLVLVIALLAGCKSGSGDHVAPAPQTQATGARRAPTLVTVPTGSGHLAAMASARGLVLRDRPGGRFVAHLQPRTEYGSPTVVWAARRRGRWLGVISTRLANNRIAWLDVQRDQPRMWRSPYSLRADLSARMLELRQGSRVVRRMHIGIGSLNTPTPTGRFSVTDKLIPAEGQAYYGCCLLALSGHQPHLRPDWAGGDRIAIHGGATGGAASAGCLHASDADLRRLMRVIPIGAPVYIKA